MKTPLLPGPAYRLCRRGDGAVLLEALHYARTAGERRRGLLGVDRLPKGAGLWLVGVRMIHTFFMRISLDVAFIAPDGTVRDIRESLPPWRVVFCRAPGSADTLEAAAGIFRDWNLQLGDRLEILPH